MGWQKQQLEHAFWQQGQRPVESQRQQLEHTLEQRQWPVGSQRQQLEHALEQRQGKRRQVVVIQC